MISSGSTSPGHESTPTFKGSQLRPFPIKGNCKLEMEVCTVTSREDDGRAQERDALRFVPCSPEIALPHCDTDSRGLREWHNTGRAHGAKAVAWVPEIMG